MTIVQLTMTSVISLILSLLLCRTNQATYPPQNVSSSPTFHLWIESCPIKYVLSPNMTCFQTEEAASPEEVILHSPGLDNCSQELDLDKMTDGWNFSMINHVLKLQYTVPGRSLSTVSAP